MKWILLSVIVVATVIADLAQSYEMKRSGEQRISAHGLVRILKIVARRKFLLLSVFCMAVSFFAFMALLQREPMSFAVPASAITIVCETLLARFVLSEAVGKRRTAGALLVLSGVILLAR